MDAHFPPLEENTQHTLAALSELLVLRGTSVPAVPCISTVAAYLVEERARPFGGLYYQPAPPLSHVAIFRGESVFGAAHSASPARVQITMAGVSDVWHEAFTVAHAAAACGSVSVLAALPTGALADTTSLGISALHMAAGGCQ